MKYTENPKPLGLGQLERKRLSELLRVTKTTISVNEAAKIWDMTNQQAIKILSLYQKKGWLKRIKHGLYIAVPIEMSPEATVPEEPFAIAEKIFSPCYISGANAANYWDLTEQLFQTITVMTTNKVMNQKPVIAGITYLLHTIKPEYFFGLKTVWFNEIKVKIADPSRMIIDMMMYPQYCGGIRFIEDVLKAYFKSNHKDTDLLLSYLQKITNGAAIKRLGFLIEKNVPEETKLIEFCLNNLKQGYVLLSPSVDCPKIITRWRLKVPTSWKEWLNDKSKRN